MKEKKGCTEQGCGSVLEMIRTNNYKVLDLYPADSVDNFLLTSKLAPLVTVPLSILAVILYPGKHRYSKGYISYHLTTPKDMAMRS